MMIVLQVVIDLDLMYSGNGSLVFSLQSMRCEIKKVVMVVVGGDGADHEKTERDNMMVSGVDTKHSEGDPSADHELSSFHWWPRGACF